MSKTLLAVFVILGIVSEAQAQRWAPSIDSTACGKISAVTTSYFDTIATYVEGRVIDGATKKPISKAVIHVAYYDCHSIALKTKEVVCDEKGIFKLGWVGCASARLLTVEALGFCTMQTGRVTMGGLSEVIAELLPLAVTNEGGLPPKNKK
ncbi:hypothetical protein J4D99_14400 [Siccationidurans ginsengisoli]|nr:MULTISPECIES: hypothetical protein [unclassified Hymenobacter]MBO2032585.1 hypothetical protein [Hymenobacter sp. BT559]